MEKIIRPSIAEVMLMTALVMASRSTCRRRKVGCVLTDERGRVLATGYNGVARGQHHCTDNKGCVGARAVPGTSLELCAAVHAEQNAMLLLRDPDKLETIYSTTSPCASCVKLLLNTSCQRIVFLDEYAETAGKVLWEGTGRAWVKHNATIIELFHRVYVSLQDEGEL